MAKDFEKIVKRYNDIMNSLCREYATIGTRLTEDAENKSQWTLRDLVSEIQYTLDVYRDPQSTPYDSAHFMGGQELKDWRSSCARMQRFINTFADEAMKYQCYENHCSKFD